MVVAELNEKVLGEHRKAFPEIFAQANQRLGVRYVVRYNVYWLLISNARKCKKMCIDLQVFGLKAVEIYRSKVGQPAPPPANRSYVLVSSLGPDHISQLAQDR